MRTLLTSITLFISFIFSHNTYASGNAEVADNDSTGKAFEFGLDYTGELHTDFRDASAFLNLLRLNGKWNISDNVSLCISTLSINAEDYIADDILVYSNIQAVNYPLTFAVAGVEWTIPTTRGHHTLFAGIRNTGEDYFASDVTSFFTNSSCGIHPTVSSIPFINTYPLASVGIHYRYEASKWAAQASLYNGQGHYKLNGRDNLFRVCPDTDGILALSQVEYRHDGSFYALGGGIQHGEVVFEDECIDSKRTRTTLWTYAEQRLFSTPDASMHLLAAYSHNFTDGETCRDFAGIGAKLDIRGIGIGLFAQHASFTFACESAVELTCKIPVKHGIYIMPTLHYVKGTYEDKLLGVMRFGISL